MAFATGVYVDPPYTGALAPVASGDADSIAAVAGDADSTAAVAGAAVGEEAGAVEGAWEGAEAGAPLGEVAVALGEVALNAVLRSTVPPMPLSLSCACRNAYHV